ncbi:hypothetical protein [Janibacter cremeus]|uniref:Uncharacterized protein n=1 Tax=Janibacter cremeus TaxID=1285192 RepID=A0A852VRN6_9MICO|nr:hypothetical protein [Janibacter cremeus]NYF97363.1 hypothetical protein [Janibacter cremeus]
MTASPPSPSRRTVAKGAAWTVPALSVAAAAPTLAASPTLQCPAAPGWTVVDPAATPEFVVTPEGSGSRVDLRFGTLTPMTNAPAGATHFQWQPTGSLLAADQNGDLHGGSIYTYTGTPAPLSAGSDLRVLVDFSSFSSGWDENRRLEAYTVPYRVRWYEGDPNDASSTTLLDCDYSARVTATSWNADHSGGGLSPLA